MIYDYTKTHKASKFTDSTSVPLFPRKFVKLEYFCIVSNTVKPFEACLGLSVRLRFGPGVGLTTLPATPRIAPYGTLASVKRGLHKKPNWPIILYQVLSHLNLSLEKTMQTLIDPWVVQYERLMEILKEAAVSTDLSPRIMKKIFVYHRRVINDELYEEGIRLFNYVYKDEI